MNWALPNIPDDVNRMIYSFPTHSANYGNRLSEVFAPLMYFKQYVRGVIILPVALGWQDIQAAEKEIYMRTFFLMIASQTYSKI